MLPVGFRSIIGGLIEAEGSLYVPAKVMVSPPWEPQTPTLEVECACGPLLGLPPAYPVSGVPQPGVGGAQICELGAGRW